mgnify:CR=1 FL=1
MMTHETARAQPGCEGSACIDTGSITQEFGKNSSKQRGHVMPVVTGQEGLCDIIILEWLT